jgi:hypothetical protein
MNWKTLFRAAGLLLFFCLLVAGCGPDQKARGKVKGKVKFFDKNLTCGTVTFVAKDGRVGSGNIDFDGNYEVNDAPIGDTTVTVKVPSVMRVPKGGQFQPKPPGNMPEMKGSGGGGNPTIDPTKIVEIPGKYGAADTSNLTYTVVKGEQTHNITLTP